jgi:hypothetical protein
MHTRGMNLRVSTLSLVALTVVLLTCGGDLRRDTGHLLTDAGTWLLDMDASAQADSGPAGSLPRVLTADTDLNRMETAIVSTNGSNQQLATGPIVITDIGGGGGANYWLAPAGGCTTTATTAFYVADRPLTGTRILVRSGQALCVSGSGSSVLWSGFRPFE